MSYETIYVVGVIVGIAFIVLFLRDFGYLKAKPKKVTKADIDEKMVIYEKERALAINREIQQKIEVNWQNVDAARSQSVDMRVKINKEISELEARKESLKNEIEKDLELIKKERVMMQSLIDAKNKEIDRLTELTNKVIDNSNKILLNIQKNR